jgi:HemK-related putative methylase
MAPAALRQRLWRIVLGWKFALFQRHRHDRLALERVAGFDLVVLPQVFNPALFRTSDVLAEFLLRDGISPSHRVLDMGTGTGVLALAAASRGASVVAVDVNPHAVRCARLNVLLNGLEDRVEVRSSDVFRGVRGERFDLVIFNAPYLAGTAETPLEHAFRGVGVVERFGRDLRDHLTPVGRALVLLSTDGDESACMHGLLLSGLTPTLVDGRDRGNEIVRIWQLVNESAPITPFSAIT